MASLREISRQLKDNDFAEGDSFWLHLPHGRIELEVVQIDTQHEYDSPLLRIVNIDEK